MEDWVLYDFTGLAKYFLTAAMYKKYRFGLKMLSDWLKIESLIIYIHFHPIQTVEMPSLPSILVSKISHSLQEEHAKFAMRFLLT